MSSKIKQTKMYLCSDILFCAVCREQFLTHHSLLSPSTTTCPGKLWVFECFLNCNVDCSRVGLLALFDMHYLHILHSLYVMELFYKQLKSSLVISRPRSRSRDQLEFGLPRSWSWSRDLSWKSRPWSRDLDSRSWSWSRSRGKGLGLDFFETKTRLKCQKMNAVKFIISMDCGIRYVK